VTSIFIGVNLIGVHLTYGRASHIWACISHMGVHLTPRHAPETASDMGVYLKMYAYEMHTYEMLSNCQTE
jgi:hypothetical protein